MGPAPALTAVCAGLLLALAPTVASGGGLTTGFSDPVYGDPDAALRDTWLQRTQELGAGIVRLDVGWPAARRPADPRDPDDPAYDWARADAAVDAARAHGLRVLAWFTGLPPWARRATVPTADDPATYRPRAADVGAYGEALARHLAGRAEAFQVWDAPNLSTRLTPQWSDGRAASPGIYRAMLNAFAAGVRRAQPRALVVTGGTAPFGDAGHGRRMRPLTFWRALLARRARFDVLAHQLVGAGAPTRHALHADDVAVPDMGRLRRLLERVGVRARLWVTGISYASSATQAPWLEHAFELLWRGGADTVMWSAVRDPAGVLGRDGAAKPAATAFRFPFVAGGDQVWTRAPLAGTLRIQRDGRTVRTVGVRAGQVLLLKRLRTPLGARMSGVVGGVRSLAWRVDR